MSKEYISDITFENTDFTQSDLTSAIFDNCDLTRATFEHTILEKADFRWLASSGSWILDEGRATIYFRI